MVHALKNKSGTGFHTLKKGVPSSPWKELKTSTIYELLENHGIFAITGCTI
jgi:hypothetical protein